MKNSDPMQDVQDTADRRKMPVREEQLSRAEYRTGIVGQVAVVPDLFTAAGHPELPRVTRPPSDIGGKNCPRKTSCMEDETCWRLSILLVGWPPFHEPTMPVRMAQLGEDPCRVAWAETLQTL